MKKGSCARRGLVCSPVVGITRCDCGHVHVELGATTVRFDDLAFRHVAEMFAVAAAKLGEPAILAQGEA